MSAFLRENGHPTDRDLLMLLVPWVNSSDRWGDRGRASPSATMGHEGLQMNASGEGALITKRCPSILTLKLESVMGRAGDEK